MTPAVNQPQTKHDDLIQLENRCRRKSEAARWAAERLRRAREGNAFQVENPPIDPETVEWADRLTDCFYWMQSSPDSLPADLSLLDNVGGCFEAVVRGVNARSGHAGGTPGEPQGPGTAFITRR